MVESAHNYNTRYCNVMNVYTNKMYSVYEIESSILTKTTVYIQCIFIYVCFIYIYEHDIIPGIGGFIETLRGNVYTQDKY